MNSRPKSKRQPGGLTAIDGALALISILLIVQMWLLTATLESYLAGHHESAVPGVVISGLIFVASIALYLFVSRIDSEIRHAPDRDESSKTESPRDVE
jgi:hypothetical protein